MGPRQRKESRRLPDIEINLSECGEGKKWSIQPREWEEHGYETGRAQLLSGSILPVYVGWIGRWVGQPLLESPYVFEKGREK